MPEFPTSAREWRGFKVLDPERAAAGQHFLDAMELNNWSQNQLADAWGLDRAFIQQAIATTEAAPDVLAELASVEDDRLSWRQLRGIVLGARGDHDAQRRTLLWARAEKAKGHTLTEKVINQYARGLSQVPVEPGGLRRV